MAQRSRTRKMARLVAQWRTSGEGQFFGFQREIVSQPHHDVSRKSTSRRARSTMRSWQTLAILLMGVLQQRRITIA